MSHAWTRSIVAWVCPGCGLQARYARQERGDADHMKKTSIARAMRKYEAEEVETDCKRRQEMRAVRSIMEE